MPQLIVPSSSFAQSDLSREQSVSEPCRNLWLTREPYIMLGLIGAIVLIVFHDYVFLRKTYLFKDVGSDSINSFYPYMVHVVDYLGSEGLPRWSFNQGMGQNIFPYGTGDIFLPLFYLFGRNNVAFTLVFVEITKIFVGGFFFYLYLRKLQLTSFASLTGGVLFAFSGYMILGGQWYLFSYDAMYCAVLLYAFECFFQDNTWWILPIPVALLAAYQPFWLYLYGVFLLIYSTVRYLEERDWNLRSYLRLLFKTAGLAVIGVALSSIFVFEGLALMFESPRVGGDASYFVRLSSKRIFGLGEGPELSSVALRFFSNDLAGTGSSYSGWFNYLESPLLYCGLITFLAVPQYLISVGKRKKILYIALLLMGLCALVFPFFRYAFWGFSGNYYRTFSFFIAVLSLYLGMRGLSVIDRAAQVYSAILWGTLAVTLAVLHIPPYEKYVKVNKELLPVVTLLLIGYAVFLGIGTKRVKRISKWLALAATCFEVAYLSNITVNHRPVVTADELSARVGYNDHTIDAIQYIQSEDRGFFRVNKSYSSGPAAPAHESLNDAQIQQFYGTPSYSSFNQLNYIRFLANVDALRGSSDGETRQSYGVMRRPILQILSSVKYGLGRDAASYSSLFGYDFVKTFDDVSLFKNRLFLPLGFGYDKFILASDFSKLDKISKDHVLLKAIVIDDADQPQYAGVLNRFDAPIPLEFSNEELEGDVERLRSSAMTMVEHRQNRIRGTIKLDQPTLLFFSIPYDKGWSATVDGQQAKIQLVDFGMSGLLLDKGEHQIDLKFGLRFFTAGAIISLTTLVGFVVSIFISSRAARGRPRFVSPEAPVTTS